MTNITVYYLARIIFHEEVHLFFHPYIMHNFILFDRKWYIIPADINSEQKVLHNIFNVIKRQLICINFFFSISGIIWEVIYASLVLLVTPSGQSESLMLVAGSCFVVGSLKWPQSKFDVSGR